MALADEDGRFVEGPGALGEIWIAGPCLSPGYWRYAGSDESFVKLDGRPWYRTGDIGSYGQDGLLYFIGRRDGQFKRRGMRMELGEIEHCMREFPGVEQAAVRWPPTNSPTTRKRRSW